jgi:hypothetical protein
VQSVYVARGVVVVFLIETPATIQQRSSYPLGSNGGARFYAHRNAVAQHRGDPNFPRLTVRYCAVHKVLLWCDVTWRGAAQRQQQSDCTLCGSQQEHKMKTTGVETARQRMSGRLAVQQMAEGRKVTACLFRW